MQFFHPNHIELEIKPCGLGSRILDMEADMVNIFDLHGGCYCFLSIKRTGSLNYFKRLI